MTAPVKDYDASSIEPRWQSFWERNESLRPVDLDPKPKYYILDMFPYPSGAGLHIGHSINYTPTDIFARYKYSRGFNVLHPMGWDAFGLPTEQFAIQTGARPEETNRKNIANFKRQIRDHGFLFAWDREINTTDPDYFRWTQWIFLRLFERGLAYVEKKPVWWCDALKTVLANEEVLNTDEGPRSERGNHPVERRPLRQWVLRITAYADRLLKDLHGLDWPESTKRMQEAWIGRSEGAEIEFPLESTAHEPLRVFTTRPDTLFGATYMVLAPEHPAVKDLTTPDQADEVDTYVRRTAVKTDLERTDLAKEKTGVFTGGYALHPLTGHKLPVWVADYVLMTYGTGAIMAVPAHDERDYEFARKYQIPIQKVIEPADESRNGGSAELPYMGEGRLVHSDDYTGLDWAEAKRKITADLEAARRGRYAVQYKLRDWLFSRQRYWGEPFPVVWVTEMDYKKIRSNPDVGNLPSEPVAFEENGIRHYAVPLPESALPLRLPEVESYQPSGSGESPLANATDWLEIWHHPVTGESRPASGPRPEGEDWVRARRETNTMPQWAGSCWYYLRFLDPRNSDKLVDPEKAAYWREPDIYVGGAEHAVLHLLYARFWHKALFDLGVVPFPEPFPKLFHQGVILGPDGQRMSKSRGNVVNPDEVIQEYGADTLRLYLMFLGPLDAMKPWNPRGIEGVHRFLKKVWREVVGPDGDLAPKISPEPESDGETLRLLHETIRKVTEDIEALRFNTAISQMMIWENYIQKREWVGRDAIESFLRLLAPFAPHLAEELWSRMGHDTSILEAGWPSYDPSLLTRNEVKIMVQINGKIRGELMVASEADQNAVLSEAVRLPKVEPLVSGKKFKKIVFVPGRILNLVLQND